MSSTRLTRTEMLEAAETIRRLLDTLRAGELTAPAMLVARLEGALVALEVVATGRAPTPDDLLKGESLHETKDSNKRRVPIRDPIGSAWAVCGSRGDDSEASANQQANLYGQT